MTLFFVPNEIAHGIGKRLEEDTQKLLSVSDVVVVVDSKDRWKTTVDRHHAHGQIVHPQRRVELLERYTTIAKPSYFL